MKVRPVVATSWMLGELRHRFEVANDALAAAKVELSEVQAKEESSIIKGAYGGKISELLLRVEMLSYDVENEGLRVSAMEHHEAPRVAVEFEV